MNAGKLIFSKNCQLKSCFPSLFRRLIVVIKPGQGQELGSEQGQDKERTRTTKRSKTKIQYKLEPWIKH
jgi:hypothetical protein